MDHAPGMRPAAGSGTGPAGTAAPGTHHRPRPPSGGNAGYPGGNATARQGNARYPPGGNARSPGGGNARHPVRKCAASRRETRRMAGGKCADHRPPDDNAAGQRPLDGKRNWPAKPAAERTPGGGPGERVWIARSFRVDETVRGRARAGRTRPRWRAGRAGRAAHFQITSSEIANTCSQHRKRQLSIHLRASYPNEISCCR